MTSRQRAVSCDYKRGVQPLENGATVVSDMAGYAARVAVERSGSCRETKGTTSPLPAVSYDFRHSEPFDESLSEGGSEEYIKVDRLVPKSMTRAHANAFGRTRFTLAPAV